MISLGQMNRAQVTERADNGWLLQCGDEPDTIVLPFADAPEQLELEQSLHVFVYRNGEGDIVATTARPKAMVGQVALLRAKHQTAYGTFFDWGLSKDLFVPRGEQGDCMEANERYMLFVYVDDEDRIAASAKVRKFLDIERHSYQDGDEVHLTVIEESPLGYNTAVDYQFSGLLYSDQIFRSVKVGDQIKGYVRQVREDGLLDVTTQKPGYGKVPDLADQVLETLNKRGGELPLSDKSSPAQIKQQFNCSKKAFKQAIGALKKQGSIDILPDQIKLK